MQLKSFRTATMHDALARVRQELGPEALVLSARVVPQSTWRGWMGAREVEVTAALDSEMSESRPSPSPGRQVAPVSAVAGRDLAMSNVVARLCASGLDPAFAYDVARAMPASQRRGASASSLRRAVASELAPLAAGAEPMAPVEVFVGPPGVGKTTTIAKIAAQERVKGGRRLGLVAADGFRVGAVEQLRMYADVIGSPCRIARSAGELERVLGESPKPVLVDTAGRPPGDGAVKALLAALARRADVRTHLVLSAGSQLQGIERTLERYRAAKPDRIVLTKVDEVDSIASLVTALRRYGIPLSFVCAGQRVPEDAERATGSVLAGYLLGDGPAPRESSA